MTKSRGTAFAVWFALMLWAFWGTQAAQAPVTVPAVPKYEPKFFPFADGEKAVYRAQWAGMVSVATAEVVTTPTVVDGQKVYRVTVEAKSARALDWIWKMRDTITSTFDAKALAPSRFTFRQRENSKEIDTVARYDQATGRWAIDR